jgi:hypothetical protein
MHARPFPAILDVPPEVLKPVAGISSRKEIHASRVLEILDADEHQP